MLQRPTSRRPLARRIFRGVTMLAVSGPVAVGALLGWLWLEHGRTLTLPKPTGSFAVGRTLFDWVDENALDPVAPVPGTRREVLVWIWYPAEAESSGAVMDSYVPAVLRRPTGSGGDPGIFRLLTRDLSKVHGHSLRDAKVSPKQRSYPVAILRAGASSEVMNYSTLAEDLASHGYVVVGIDAPYRTMEVVFPDGRAFARTPENNLELYSGEEQIRRANKLNAAWTGDIGFVLDRLQKLNASDESGKFKGRLDLTRVGVFGHSLGGAQAAQFCSQDLRCKAGIDIDGALVGSVIQTGIHKPFLFLLSGKGDFSTVAENRQVLADIQSVYDRLPAGERLRVVIRGANHFTFSDDGALLKSSVLRGLFRAFGKLGIQGRRQLAATAYCVHSFFDAYLKGPGVSPVGIPSSVYPEIQVLE